MSEFFSTNLFARHPLPFAAYAEPEGFNRLNEMLRPQGRHYDKFVPDTSAAAEALFSTIEQIGEWGAQYVITEINGTHGAAWRTHNAAHKYPARGGQTRRGKELRVRDVLRSLTRGDIYAVGRTDRHIADLEFGPFGNGDWRTTPVSVLCLDVDMDRAWETENAAPIRRELAIEAQLANALGLPYRAFRTGGRGHQAVLPLPAPIDRSAAAWLLDAYLSLLVPYHRQAANEAKADAHNLHGVVRVAGGRHAGTKRVAFWIDPSRATLYPIERQMELMRTGYCHLERGTITAQAFTYAASELSDYLLRRFHIPSHEYADSIPREIAFWGTVEELHDNPLVSVFQAAKEEWALADDDLWETAWTDSSGNDGVAGELTARPSATQQRAEQRPSTDEGTRAWAERVWAVDWPAPNLFWDWVNEGGQRGITAAKVLFGEEEDAALEAMLRRVDAHPISAAAPAKARTRKRVLRTLFKSHVMPQFQRRATVGTDFDGEAFDHARSLAARTLSAEATALIPKIFARVHAAKPVQSRCVRDIEHIIEIVLLSFEEYVERHQAADETELPKVDYIELSLNSIVLAIQKRWPDTPSLDRSTARRHLKRLASGTSDCGYALMTEVPQSKHGVLSAARYRAGEDLRATVFGSTLPHQIAGADAPRALPSGPEIIRARWIRRHPLGTVKRGRRPLQNVSDAETGEK